MRTRVVLCGAALLGLAGSACDSDSSSPTATAGVAVSTTVAVTIAPADLTSKASQLTDLLIANNWKDATATFASSLAARFDAVALKTAWESMTASFGAYKSRGATASASGVYETPMVFGTTAMTCQIRFDPAGKVSDLLIVKA